MVVEKYSTYAPVQFLPDQPKRDFFLAGSIKSRHLPFTKSVMAIYDIYSLIHSKSLLRY